jgi:alpha-L-arabinofuranosidase
VNSPPAPTPASVATITVVNQVKRKGVTPLMQGCHTDLGYDHQIYGFYSQMVYGESFEDYTLASDAGPQGNMWEGICDAGVKDCATPVTRDRPLHGEQAQTIAHGGRQPGVNSTRAGVVNRGFKHQGLHLLAGGDYAGSFFVRPTQGAAAPASITVSLEDYFTPNVYAAQILPMPTSANWTQVFFNLTVPSTANIPGCRDFPFATPPLHCTNGSGTSTGTSGHACVQCGGQLVIALHGQGSVDLDYAELHPGNWGRFAGLLVKRDAAAWLRRAGVDSIRTGGTYVEEDTDQDPTSGAGYLWKKLRGPRWLRPGAVRSEGGPSRGDITTRGWAIFEAIEMCEAMGIEPIITLHSSETKQDLQDLVSYLFATQNDQKLADDGATGIGSGGGIKTAGLTADANWANLRAEDGHPAPYNITWFEIGNEIKTPDFGGRASAMEAAAKRVGVGGKLKYVCPTNCGANATVLGGARELGDNGQIYIDIHVAGSWMKGASGGYQTAPLPYIAQDWVSQFEALNSSARLVVWETNTAKHDFSRVPLEGGDLNQLQGAVAEGSGPGSLNRIDSRVESFCMEMSGHDHALVGTNTQGDQGSIFFLPNQTWGQPPHYVHEMVHTNQLATVLNATCSQGAACEGQFALAVLAGTAATSVGPDGSTNSAARVNVVVRITNPTQGKVLSTVSLHGFGAPPSFSIVHISQLYSDALGVDNPPSDPARYSPESSSISLSVGQTAFDFEVQPSSFAVLRVV